MTRLSRLLPLLVLLVLAPGVVPAQRVIDLDIGSVAPDMSLETLDGKPASLAPYLGKTPLFIEVWASWCENCEALAPRILEAKRKYGSQMRFLGVAESEAFQVSEESLELRWVAPRELAALGVDGSVRRLFERAGL